MASARSVLQSVLITITALLVASASATAASVREANSAPPPVVEPPNFVVIVLDDLGTDKLGFYGQSVAWEEEHPVTPNLDALAANGALFWNAYASPLCSPSRAMLLTGRQAFKTGMFNLSDLPGSKFDLPDSEVMLPEMLKGIDDSYTAGAFGKWHLADGEVGDPLPDCEHPIRNEFDVFAGHLHNVDDHFDWDRTDTRVGCAPQTSTTWIGTQVRTDAWDWIQEQEGPFFAYVAFHPPHGPFQVPPLAHVTPGLVPVDVPEGTKVGGVGCSGPCTSCSVETDNWLIRTVYRANIEAIDYEIGELLDQLPENTYVFIIGDNGTELRAVQSADSNYSTAGAPYPPLHSKRTITQLGVRVPLLVTGPSVVPGIRRAPVSAVDLWRTMADLAGNAAAAAGNHSVSFRPLLEASETWPPPVGSRRRAYVELAGSNGSTWASGQWTPSAPTMLQRAFVSYDGLKYMRYGQLGQSTPTCVSVVDCSFSLPTPPAVKEEVHRLYTYVGSFQSCDENETGAAVCGAAPTCVDGAVLSDLMTALTGP